MKSGSALCVIGIALCLSVWQPEAVSLRARNSTAGANPRLTGLLCRDPGANSDDVDVVLEEGGRRSLLFTRNVKDSKGNVLGREVAGMQSTVHCAAEVARPEATKCVPADLDKPVPTCAEVGKSGRCDCSTINDEPLKLAYQQRMVSETVKLCKAKAASKQPFRVLMFGLGGGAVPMYIRHHCDSALIESVEKDARVALIAQRLFGFRADSKNKVEIADGEEAAERHAKTHPWPKGPHYDVVLVDCFDSKNRVASSCRSDRFFHAVRTTLDAEGSVMQNVMDVDVNQLLPMYQATFGPEWTQKQVVQDGQFLIIGKTHANHPSAHA